MAINLKKSGELLISESRKEVILTDIIPSIGEKVTLLAHHKEELQQSGIDERILELNFFSIRGESVTSFLNLSAIPGFSFKYGSVIFHGGWMCGNVLKPDKPRTVKKKPNKYENPVDGDLCSIRLKLPEEIWQAIGNKYGVEKPTDIDGWAWVEQNPQIPVVVCEGVKKAACVISQILIPAIALSGHTSAVEKDGGDVRFAEFLHPNRDLIICFDNEVSDIKASDIAKTVKRIFYKIRNLSTDKKSKEVGARAKLLIAHWHHPEKGIDDVWLKHGKVEVERLISSAISCHQWVDTSFNKLGFEPDYQFNAAKWQWIDIPENSRLICLIGAKGTGKSWCLEQMTLQAKNEKRPVITATHRIQLSMSLAGRLQITFINDIDGKIETTLQIALVIDSLPKINPKKFAGCIFILDETVQMLDHFLLGETCAYKRQAILNTMRELCTQIINSDGKLILADADLNGATIRFFSGLMGDEKPFIIQNTYREPSYICHLSNGFVIRGSKGGKNNTPADIVSVALSKAIKRERIYIACSGQTEESTWGSISLEGIFLNHGITDVIRIDSETIKNPEHPAFKATSRINEICDTYQVIIATPTLGTGVSIENRNPFDLVCGIFTGVVNPDSVRQSLMRIRDKGVPRLIYCAVKGLNEKLASLGNTAIKVEDNVKELVEFQRDVLTEHDEIWSAEYPEIRYNQSASACFNAVVADKNKQNSAYKNYVRQGLKDENVTVIDISEACEIYDYGSINPQEVYELAKTVTEAKVRAYRAKILEQKRLESEEYEKLKSATELNEQERIALEATALSNRYGGIEVTKDLLEKDSEGWYEKIKLHYASTDGYEHLKNIQALVSNTQLHRGEGELIEHDFMARNKILAQAEHMRATEIIDLIAGQSVFSANDEESVSLCNDLIEQIPTINLIHEQNIKSSSYKSGEFNFKLIELISSFIGTESKCIGRPLVNGKQVRQYTLKFADDNRREIFELWRLRDIEIEKRWFKRKKDWEIRQVVAKINLCSSVSEFEEVKQLELFNEAWERTLTETRTKIINKVDSFSIPKNRKLLIDATNLVDVKEAFSKLSQWDVVSLDCETFGNDKKNKEGLHKFKAQLRLLQLSNGSTTYTFDFGERGNLNRAVSVHIMQPFIAALMSSKHQTIIGHNLNFDLGILYSTFELKANCQFSDTLLGIQIFTGIYNGKNVWEGFSLKVLAHKLLGLEIDKTEQKSDWGQALTDSQINYAADDPHTTYWVWKRLNEWYNNPAKFGFAKLARWDMTEAWKLENACLVPLAEMEQAGLPLNKDSLDDLASLINIKISDTLKQWIKLTPNIERPTMGRRLIAHLNAKYNLNLTSCDKKVLSDYKHLPEVALRFTYSGLLQYQARLKKLLVSAKNCSRGKTFYSVLSGTGRTSSGGKFDDIVNIQSIPAKVDESLKKLEIPSLRSAFKVSNGKALIVSDLAAAHARIACDFAQDILGMLVQNNDNIDAHSLFAIKIAQCLPEQIRDKGLPERFLTIPISVEQTTVLQDFKSSGKSYPICKQLRDVSKNIFYGKLNGASWSRIQSEVRGQLKISCSQSEARAISTVFEELYPELTAYCKVSANRLEEETNQIWIDGKLFGITAIAETNQRLLFYLKESDNGVQVPYTNVVASLWSRTEATAMKKSLVLCHALLARHPEWEAKIINIVHDELNVECNSIYAKQVAKTVAWVMSRNFQAELKNGVNHGGANFRSEENVKSLIVESWSDK